jgi:hypothetical protein
MRGKFRLGAKFRRQCILGFMVKSIFFDALDRGINRFGLTVFAALG